ncbi:hypothetical protein D0469_11515 [Peribacillus saganii]|uniref:Uncharacterized protein n=1 Tax=Peribacillus saganii TaxID=2303992 RepID=A0A372LNM4_9BACI|nr:hypothetical protein [Peribacillus saganii]RFU68582.1 hypothetical protein D0469_11515 [Peribacillus saganii]
MLGFMISEMEQKEIEYLLKRELDEILFDLMDDRIDQVVKRAMEERYKILFNLFKRVAPPKECLKYMRTKTPAKRKSHTGKNSLKDSEVKK